MKTKFKLILSVILGFILGGPPLFAGVNPDGSYSETLPIEIPAGRNGIQPKLALSYNSNGSNGIVGVGWNIQGLPAITRINYGNGINYNGADSYVGPEGRLIDVSASASAPVGTVFHSENEAWSKYEPLGWDGNQLNAGNRCGDAACSWRVTDRGGIVSLYGDAGASRVVALDAGGNPINLGAVRVWALSRVTDLHGNYYQVEYYQNAGQYYPKKITYTLGNWASRFYAVTFDYDQSGRPDKETTFAQSSMVQTAWRLSGIAVTYKDSCFIFFTCSDAVRAYGLEYDITPNLIRSRLLRWREFDASAQTKALLSFTWNAANAGFSGAGNFNPPYALWNRPGGDSDGQRLIDVNGDGLPDLLRGLHLDGTGYFGAWINTGTGWAYAPQWNPPVSIWFSANGKKDNEGVEILDINNDGLPDIIKYLHDGGTSNYVGAWLNNGNGWSYAPQFNPPYALWNRPGGDSDGQRLVDVNGDGLPDLLRGLHLDGTGYFAAWLNTGNGWVSAPQWNPPISIWFSANGKKDNEGVEILDINNDGRPDILKYLHDGGTSNYVGAWLNNGNGWTYAPQFNPPYDLWHRPAADSDGQRLVDVNGDGLPDLLRGLHSNGTSYFGAWLNTGNGWVAAPQWNPPVSLRFNGTYTRPTFPPAVVPIKDNEGVEFVDLNKDGLVDIIKGLHDGSTYLGAWLNNGHGWTYSPEWNPPYTLGFRVGETNDNEGVQVLDLNGDGFADVIRGLHDGGPTYYGAWLNNAHHGHLISRIESSNGAIQDIEYTPARQAGNAICASCSGPGVANNAARYLVSHVTSTGDRDLDGNGLNDSFSTSYEYENGRVSTGTITERVSLGFEKIKTIDDNSQNYSITTYRQDKPFHGMVTVYRGYLANGTLVSEQYSSPSLQQYYCSEVGCSNNLSNDPTPTAPKQLRTTGESETRSYENGILIGRKFTEVLSQDIYGNPLVTKAGVTANGVTQTVYKFLQYINENTATNRALGIAYSEKVCLTASECSTGDVNFLSESRIYYDSGALATIGTRRLPTRKENYVITSDTTGAWVSNEYTFDTNGNILTHLDGVGVLTTLAYDIDYKQFVVSVTKSHGGKSSTVTAEYDPRYGKKILETFIDEGTTIETTLDSIGFATEVIVKNGLTTIAKSSSSRSGFGVVPAWGESCVHFGSDFTQKRCGKKFSDALGKVYREEFPDLVNGTETKLAIERKYDNQRRDVAVSQPFDAATGSPSQWNTRTYDPYGRVTQNQTFDGRLTSSAFQTTGLPPGIVSCTISTAHDGKQQQACNNIHGKPAFVVESYGTPAATRFDYYYDARARLTSVSAPQGPTTIGYIGISGLQAFIDDPVSGRTDFTYYTQAGQASFGQLATETRAGKTTSIEYNATFGRVSKITQNDSVTTFAYDETDAEVGIFGANKPTTLIHQVDGYTIKERYRYDAKAEIAEMKRWISHATETLCSDTGAMPCFQRYAVDTDTLDRVKAVTYPDGSTTDFSYLGATKHPLEIKHDGATYATYGNYTYDVTPHIGKVTYGNGLVHDYTYQPTNGLMQSVSIGKPSQPEKMKLTYAYDASFNIGSITDTVIPDLSATYQYDNLNRIRQAAYGSGTTRDYRFDQDGASDSKGNLLRKGNRRLTYAPNKTYPVADEIFNETTSLWEAHQTMTWSAAGSLLTKGDFTYEYDSNQMMTKATEGTTAETRFVYDHTGQRFLKKHTRDGVTIKTWYLSDGIELREKYVSVTSGNPTGSFDSWQATKYVYGQGGKRIASITSNVKTSAIAATPQQLFALADGYSASTVGGVTMKVYYTFYGVYAHENFGYYLRVTLFTCLVLLLLLWLYFSSENKTRNFSRVFLRRLTAVSMLSIFISVNCGQSSRPPGVTEAQVNTIISELYTGLPPGTVYYSHNHLGSGSLVTDVNGDEIFRITYTEYGEIDLENSGKWNSTTQMLEQNMSDAELLITAVKFTGQEYDPETGFYYYNSRYYSAELGVFTTSDTEYDSGTAYGFNRHMYVGGNPVMATDPSGHWVIFGMVIGAIIGGFIGGTEGNVKGFFKGEQKWNWGGMVGGMIIGAIVGAGAGYAAGYLAGGGAAAGTAETVAGGAVLAESGGATGGGAAAVTTATVQGSYYMTASGEIVATYLPSAVAPAATTAGTTVAAVPAIGTAGATVAAQSAAMTASISWGAAATMVTISATTAAVAAYTDYQNGVGKSGSAGGGGISGPIAVAPGGFSIGVPGVNCFKAFDWRCIHTYKTTGEAIAGTVVVGVIYAPVVLAAAGPYANRASETLQRLVRWQGDSSEKLGRGFRSLGAAAANFNKTLQTGGHTLTKRTLDALGLTKQQGKIAIEALKKATGRGNNFHGKIMGNGDFLDSKTGEWIGNLFDYIP